MAGGRKWVYTPEQAQKIVNGDIEARNQFYFDNYELLHILAYWYASERFAIMGDRYEVDDLMSQVYLDLPYMNFTSCATLTYSIKQNSFFRSVFGGFSFSVEEHRTNGDKKRLVAPLMSTDETRGESDCLLYVDLFVSCNPFDEFFDHADEFDYAPALRSILARYLKPVQVEFVLLVCEGYAQAEACRQLGVRGMTLSALAKRLRPHYAEIVDELLALGCSSAETYYGVIPSDKPAKKAYKMTEEERAKAREQRRNYRARKRAEQLALEADRTAGKNTEKAPVRRGRKKAV